MQLDAIDLRILDEHGADLPPGEVGEISADELTEQLTDLAWHGAKTAWSPAHRSRA